MKIKVLLHADRVQSNLSNAYFIEYRIIDISASRGVIQTEALSVGFNSRNKVKLKTRERRGKRSRENRGTKKSSEAIQKRKTNRYQ